MLDHNLHLYFHSDCSIRWSMSCSEARAERVKNSRENEV